MNEVMGKMKSINKMDTKDKNQNILILAAPLDPLFVDHIDDILSIQAKLH